MTKTQTQYLVIGLVGLWAGLLVLRVTAGETPQNVASTVTPNIQAAGKPSSKSQGLSVLSLDPPARDRESAPKRNIFVAGSSALAVEDRSPRVVVKKASPPHPSLLPPPPIEVVTVAPVAPPEPTPEERAEQEASQQREHAMQQLKQLKEQMEEYRYLGVLTQDGVHRAFLGKGHQIYILRTGDRLEGKFVVSSVNMAAVKLRAIDSDLETTIHLKKDGEGKTS